MKAGRVSFKKVLEEEEHRMSEGRRKRLFYLHLAPVSEVGLGIRPLDTCEIEFHTSCEVCSDFLLYRANRFLY